MLEWQQYVGGTRWDFAYSLDIDRNNNILIAGQTWSATNYFAGKRRSVDTTSPAYKSVGGVFDTVYRNYDTIVEYDTSFYKRLASQYSQMNDAFVAKFSSSGQLLNIKCFGGSVSDKFIHIHDHPVNGYVAVGYSDSKDMDLPVEGTKGGLWMLHLDTALNIIQNKIIDSSLIGKSFFFTKDKKMYLSDSVRFRELGYDGLVVTDRNTNGVKFDASSYFDLTGYVFKPSENRNVAVYDSILQFVDSIKLPGIRNGYHLIDGTNRNNLYVINNSLNEERYHDIDFEWDIYSNTVLNFSEQYNLVTGNIFIDNNSNGIKDIGEYFINNLKIEAKKGNRLIAAASSMDNGYNIPLDSGQYTIKVSSSLPYYTIAPASVNLQFPAFDKTDTINFALQPIGSKKDLSINLLPLNIARPGFPVQYQLICTNQGTETISNVQVKFVQNPRVSFVSASPVVNTTVGDTLIWNIASMKPFDTSYINLDLRIAAPPAVNNTDTLLFKSFVFPLIADETPEDNQFNLVQQVQGSYDPNDKTETHGGIITPEQLAGDEFLTYLIRFQNTGTDTAFTVMIRDTLTNKLDWSSFEMLSSSHPYQLYMIKPHILEFSFPNILLVDSSKNEPASHGFVAYRIKPKSNLAVGDTVLNRAHIYFDYNLPVITNDELTVLRNTVITSVIDIDRPDNQLLLYPNPSNGLVTIFRKGRLSGNANLQIIDMNGKVVHRSNLGQIATEQFNQTIDISNLPKGFYLISLRVGKDQYTCRFIIQ
ncbi:T9SS type A sorting domain-containing protein [Lacibacter sp. H407]|uniref:T9SS type A sorting domain-containing protein n=1 Tax=Lacibacter sp. H407 TaxID=3133423 RepID=UPI0030C5B714